MFDSEFEENLFALRREKLRAIAALAAKSGLTPAEACYPSRFPATGSLDDIPALRRRYDGTEQGQPPVPGEDLEMAKPRVAVAGRLMAIRVQGKAGFAHLQGGGERLQLYVRRDAVGEDAFALYKLLDLGDHIGVEGYLFRTRTGELTVHVETLRFLAKAMLALPDKYHGLEDTELRYRRRYVDLFMNTGATTKAVSAQPAPEPPHTAPDALPAAPARDTGEDAPENVREVFVKRAAILRALRRFFDARGYLEVETPMMHTVAGGAAARPFKTHHNALDLDLSLRIAPELFLKRLVVGGLDRVYEINRNFRNEGVSTRHNPEFTMLEFYQAYASYHDLMDLTEELVTTVATEVNGTPITHFNGHKIDLSKWQRLSMREAIVKWWSKDLPSIEVVPVDADFSSAASLQQLLRVRAAVYGRLKAPLEQPSFVSSGPLAQASATMNYGDLAKKQTVCMEQMQQLESGAPIGKTVAAIFELVAEPHLIQPTIIYDFPLAVSPLSKQKPDEPDWVERFEFYIGGFEVGNAFSELNDPEEQRRRFEDQLKERDRGDDEAHAMDEDYVRALGYGLPPTGGEGIGIDRLTMILTGARSIRDVILFPLLRPEAPSPAPRAPGTDPDEGGTHA